MPLKTDELKLLSVLEKKLEFIYILKVILTKFILFVSFEKTKSFFLFLQDHLWTKFSYKHPPAILFKDMSSSRNVKWLKFHSTFYNQVDLKSSRRKHFSCQ